MIKKAMIDFPEISLDDSWIIGDTETDQKCAANTGMRFIMIGQLKKRMQKTFNEFSSNSLIEAIKIIEKQNG
jgi:histidinol phosphatase-like enzyme